MYEILSKHFWHLFRKCAFTRINSICEIQSISRLILAFNSFNLWGFEIFIYWGHLKNKVYATNPHTLYRNWKYQAWNWLFFRNLINPCKCTFPKKMLEMCGWRRTNSNISCYKVRDYFSLQFYSIVTLSCMQLGYCFDLFARTWTISGLHLRKRHYTFWYCRKM